ncbi:DMT family transporter [Oceanobacter kriegii]|uniref:DMT family transporter n=1 Tax=Oceanobacter kriegii TaxID=64972 RepID=UPI000427D177|nr:DMT family transporter [Oceanobacter kriegii]
MNALSRFSPNPAVVLLFASILWGSAWIPLNAIQSMGLQHSQLLLVAYWVGSLLTLLLAVRSWQRCCEDVLANRKEFVGILLFGGVANVSFSIALMEGNVVRVMVLFYLLPVWSTLLGKWWLQESINLVKTLMIAMALVGVAMVAGLRPDNLDVFMATPWGLADTLGLVAGFTYAANNVLFRKTEQAQLVAKVGVMLLGSALSLTLVVALGLGGEGGGAHGAVAVAQDVATAVPVWAWLAAVLYGCTWLMLMSFGSQWGVSKLPASRSALIIIMELVTAVLSAELLGESALDMAGWLGCGLILAASILDGRSETQPSLAT